MAHGNTTVEMLLQKWVDVDGKQHTSWHLSGQNLESIFLFGNARGFTPVGKPVLAQRDWKTHDLIVACNLPGIIVVPVTHHPHS